MKTNNTTKLNPRQLDFCWLYVSGPDEIRGNATAAYKAAGYQPKTDRAAETAASALMRNHEVSENLARLYRQADAAAIAKMRDWKTMAPTAQEVIASIARGVLPNPDNSNACPTLITNRDDAAVAKVRLQAAMYIVERAYPAKRYCDVEIVDPIGNLSCIFGITREELTQIEDFQGHAAALSRWSTFTYRCRTPPGCR